MVSLAKENAYQLREFAHRKAGKTVGGNPFKLCFFSFLGLAGSTAPSITFESLSLYQKCTISGLRLIEECVSKIDLLRLLGQAPCIDLTPMAWVSDVIGVMSIKWLVEAKQDEKTKKMLQSWLDGFLLDQTKSGRLNLFECDISQYVLDSNDTEFTTAAIPLFLHYQGKLRIAEQQARQDLIAKFMKEFQYHAPRLSSTALLSILVYVFDNINQDIALVPPSGWSLVDLIGFLERIPVGLKRWTWEEDKGRTKNSDPVKWLIKNEYHVQNLLYVLLAPVIDDIADEIYLDQVGQKTPRADLYLPPIHTIIEVKYRKDFKKKFPKLIGEVAEDVSLYRSDPKYQDARLVCFLWDHTRSTQEHAKFKEGVLKIPGIDGCAMISSPSVM